jgi:hypothetical protein
MGFPQVLFLVTAGLGLINLFVCFANWAGGASFFEAGLGWIPGLLLVGGLAALFGILPGEHEPGPWPAVFTLGATLPMLFTVFQSEADMQAGGVMVLIFGILQMLVAIAAYLFDAGILTPPAPQPHGPYGHAGPYGQPASGSFAQQQPFGQQPTTFAQPVNQQGQQQGQQQPTTYASQQGQFFQQQSSDASHQNSPGSAGGPSGG